MAPRTGSKITSPVSARAPKAAPSTPPPATSTLKPFTGDASRGLIAPTMASDLVFSRLSSSGLRQYSGWVREEFLPQLVGRQAARTFREMLDNSSTVGAVNFAIQQSMRQSTWRIEAPETAPLAKAQEYVEFVESVMDDMADTWSGFIAEALSMLPYGFAPHELILKRRMGRDPKGILPGGVKPAKSKYSDGLIGIRKLPLMGQDTILKWFFDTNGDLSGITQQPWTGPIVDLPIEKLLLFRPKSHKSNPEGYSILRTAFRSWFFSKRLEEQEAVYLERMSGVPEYKVPYALLEAASATPPDPLAVQALTEIKKVITNVRIDEQMGIVTPSDTFLDNDGKNSNVPQYSFSFVVPQGSRGATSFDVPIARYKLDIMTSVLADFLTLGHTSRGAQALADTKVDLFFQATEGWLQSIADVLNDHLLPRLWGLNGFDFDLMPSFAPDMPQRIDLDMLSNFVLRLSQAGARLFPDDATEEYLRDAAGLPELTPEQMADVVSDPVAKPGGAPEEGSPAGQVQKQIAGMLLRRMERHGLLTSGSGRKRKRRR